VVQFDKFFSPGSLVFLGASADPGKWGYRILSNILMGGYQGKIYPVNPKGGEILGLPVYASVASVPGTPDLAIIVVPPTGIVEAIQDCVDRGVKSGVVITAGFAETGRRGANLQQRMLETARKGGMRLIGPNCFGILSPSHRLFAQMPPIFPPPGEIAVVSQSGNVGGTIARRAMALNFGISRLVSTGNEADLHAEDFIEFTGWDELTRVILAYIEGFKDGRRFFQTAQKVSLAKPIVLVKVGETEAGASAARSHTASLSGSSAVFEGICRQAGIIKVQNLQELMNVGYGFLCHPLPRGRRVGIATLGGGWGVLAADACARLGLEVVKLSEEVIRELDSFLPGWWSRNNPVDLVAGSPDNILRAIEVLAKYEQTDSVISLGVPFPRISRAYLTLPESGIKKAHRGIVEHYVHAFGQIREISRKYNKPVIIAADLFTPAGDRALEQEIMRSIAVERSVCYSMPHEAAMVLSAMAGYSEFVAGIKGNR